MKRAAKANRQKVGAKNGDDSDITFTWERSTATKVRVSAWHSKTLFHCEALPIDSPPARARFAQGVIKRAKAQFKVSLDAALIEEQLMIIASESTEPDAAVSTGPPEYYAIADAKDPENSGIYRRTSTGESQITNFIALITRVVKIHDDIAGETRFEGKINLCGRKSPFEIPAADYADSRRLMGTFYAAAGSQVRTFVQPNVVRDAVSSLSSPTQIERTTNLGWSPDGTVYLARSGVVTATGFRAYNRGEIQVDLSREQCARHLDLRLLKPSCLAHTRKHLVVDFLRLHAPAVMYSLLAVVALAVLYRFVEGKNRFALWLRGITGEGKSFLGKLAQNFFGDFPVQDGARAGSWTSTVYFLQRQGYFFKDALYLIDDYKAESVRSYEVVKLLQNYADGSARGRLKVDATTNVSREIRGIMVATGEDVPEHTSSALARTIVIDLQRREKDIERGQRCLERRRYYRGVMADFIRWLIVEERPPVFRMRVDELQKTYYREIAGQQNDLRIAANFALLGAAFEQIAAYLADIWDEADEEAEAFVGEILPKTRDQMVGTVREQQASQVFLAESDPWLHSARSASRDCPETDPAMEKIAAPLVGRLVGGQPKNLPMKTDEKPVIELSLKLATGEIQKSLSLQRRPPLQVTEQALIEQFVADGLLLDQDGEGIRRDHNGDKTFNRRLNGAQTRLARFPVAVITG